VRSNKKAESGQVKRRKSSGRFCSLRGPDGRREGGGGKDNNERSLFPGIDSTTQNVEKSNINGKEEGGAKKAWATNSVHLVPAEKHRGEAERGRGKENSSFTTEGAVTSSVPWKNGGEKKKK